MVRPSTSIAPLLGAAVAAGILVTGSAQAGPRTEPAAVLELYAAEAALARAEASAAQLEARSAELGRSERDARIRASIVRRSLEASRRRVAELVRELYLAGDPDPLAVILGASSLDEAMEGIEGLARATALNERLAAEAKRLARRLERLQAGLASTRRALDEARSNARTGAERLAAAVAVKRGTIAALRRGRSLTTERLAELETRARAAQQRGEEITRAAGAGAAQRATARPGAGRTLVVDAVAYHLPGFTASGLPVGIGVIAVDPSVIPLGTRVFVPGYGPAVAADVGTAVKGNIIDLWMPSTAQARRWGRRTVTMTIYG